MASGVPTAESKLSEAEELEPEPRWLVDESLLPVVVLSDEVGDAEVLESSLLPPLDSILAASSEPRLEPECCVLSGASIKLRLALGSLVQPDSRAVALASLDAWFDEPSSLASSQTWGAWLRLVDERFAELWVVWRWSVSKAPNACDSASLTVELLLLMMAEGMAMR